jgi:hypothetical protein
LGEGIPESVLVLSVATRIAAMAAMFEAEITQACGPKSKRNPWWPPGIAPASFYQLDADGNRQRAHIDGLPVEFIAEAIATLGAQVGRRVRDCHVMNPQDDGIGFDEYVDWLIGAGYSIKRIDDFGE